eukprot:12920939-Prorocentrum_lima.AAC.1
MSTTSVSRTWTTKLLLQSSLFATKNDSQGAQTSSSVQLCEKIRTAEKYASKDDYLLGGREM